MTDSNENTRDINNNLLLLSVNHNNNDDENKNNHDNQHEHYCHECGHDNEKKNEENIVTFALGDENHRISEDDEVILKLNNVFLDYRIYWRKNQSLRKFRKM
jgi:hypothetical protein